MINDDIITNSANKRVCGLFYGSCRECARSMYIENEHGKEVVGG